MLLYAVSKNTGPTWTGLDPLHLLYLGNSLEEAEIVVGDFSKYEREYDRGEEYRTLYSALPRNIDLTMLKYYMADGWWYTIVSFEIDSLDEEARKLGFENEADKIDCDILDAEVEEARRS